MRKFTGALVLAAALTACSTPQQQAPQVASINTGSASPGTTSAAVEQRPRLRLDMTPEDIDALYEAHGRCQAAHGVDKTKFQTQGVPSKEVMDAAEKACESTLPLPPWEKDAKNPEALDFANRVVQCLRAKGVRYVEVSNDPNSDQVSYAYGGPNNDAESITKGMELSPQCEKEASHK